MTLWGGVVSTVPGWPINGHDVLDAAMLVIGTMLVYIAQYLRSHVGRSNGAGPLNRQVSSLNDAVRTHLTDAARRDLRIAALEAELVELRRHVRDAD